MKAKKTIDKSWHSIVVCRKTYVLLSPDQVFNSNGVCPHCGEHVEPYLHAHKKTISVKTVRIQPPRKSIFKKGAIHTYWIVKHPFDNDNSDYEGLLKQGYHVKKESDEQY